MIDPCGGNTRGGDGCRCDPPFGGTITNTDPWAVIAYVSAMHSAVALLDDVRDSWDSYPEIGEHDWTLMEAKVRSLIAMPAPVELVAAYRYLAKRAEQ